MISGRYNRSGQPMIMRPIGGGGGSQTSNIWVVTAGKSILPAGVIGVRKLLAVDLTTLTLPLVADLQAPGALADGVGVVENLESGVKALVYNGASRVFHDLWVGMVFYGTASLSIPITGDIEKTQSYVVPLMVTG